MFNGNNPIGFGHLDDPALGSLQPERGEPARTIGTGIDADTVALRVDLFVDGVAMHDKV